MIWQQAVTAFVHVLVLNRHLYELEIRHGELKPAEVVEWTPVVDHNGDVRQ